MFTVLEDTIFKTAFYFVSVHAWQLEGNQICVHVCKEQQPATMFPVQHTYQLHTTTLTDGLLIRFPLVSPAISPLPAEKTPDPSFPLSNLNLQRESSL